MNISNDDFIRTTEPRHIRASQALWQEFERRGEIYLGKFAGWYSVRDEAFLRRKRARRRQGADRRRGRMGRGGELFLPPVGLAGPAARVLRAQSRFHRAARAPQRGDELRQGRAQRSVDLAHQLHLGHPGAGQSQARHVCLARRADQLPHGGRLSRHRDESFYDATGRPICTWSARTSCASTASTGRPS